LNWKKGSGGRAPICLPLSLSRGHGPGKGRAPRFPPAQL